MTCSESNVSSSVDPEAEVNWLSSVQGMTSNLEHHGLNPWEYTEWKRMEHNQPRNPHFIYFMLVRDDCLLSGPIFAPSFLLTIVIHCRRKILDHIYVIKYQFLLVIFLLLLVKFHICPWTMSFQFQQTLVTHQKLLHFPVFFLVGDDPDTETWLTPCRSRIRASPGCCCRRRLWRYGGLRLKFHRNHQFLCTWDWIGLPELMMSWFVIWIPVIR